MTKEQKLRRLKDKLFKGYRLEKYILKDGKPHPVAILCPGGGYHWVCSFTEGLPYARKLNQMGYSAVVVHYRCGKGKPYPIPQDDLARAIRHVFFHRDRWNLDIKGYSLWGSSAGGHLAASFGTEALGAGRYGLPKPAALILSYPVITMGEKAHAGSRGYLLGPEPDSEMLRLASLETQVTADYPPTFLWCGLSDRDVDPANSILFDAALTAANVPHEFVPYPGVDHGVGIGEGLPCEGWFEKAVAFWESHRKP